MDLKLQGRAVLVTGPAKGMGAAISTAFARQGARLALAGRDLAAIEPVAAARALGAEAVVLPCDLTSTEACERAVQAAGAAFGRVDVLVNVAGGSGPIGKTGWKTTRGEFDEIVTLNMAGCFNTMRAVLPGMIARRDGKIVNVGGTFGMRARAGRMAHLASKWGLRGITKSMALEAGPFNVNVNCVAPGMVDGPRFRGKVVPEMAAGLADGTIDMIATDHAPHTPEEKTRGDICEADCGFPGMETQMGLVLTCVAAGRLLLTDYVRLSAGAPARAFGLFPVKGALLPGSDADIAVVDLRREATFTAAGLHSRGRITPFEGMRVPGLPVHTLVRGRFVMRDRCWWTTAWAGAGPWRASRRCLRRSRAIPARPWRR